MTNHYVNRARPEGAERRAYDSLHGRGKGKLGIPQELREHLWLVHGVDENHTMFVHLTMDHLTAWHAGSLRLSRLRSLNNAEIRSLRL